MRARTMEFAVRRRALATALLLVGASAIVSCAHDLAYENVLHPALRFAAPDSTTVVVVVAAGACASCSEVVGSWVALVRRNASRFRLVLTSLPTESDRTGWALTRVPVAGTVEGFGGVPTDAVVVIVFNDRVPVSTDTVRTPAESASTMRAVLASVAGR